MAERTDVEVNFTRGTGIEVTNGRVSLTAQGEPAPGAWMPTELFLSGLGSCMVATLVHAAQVRGVDLGSAAARVTGDTVRRPTRFGSIQVAYELPDSLSPAESEALIRAAGRCKVHNTLAYAPIIHIAG